MPTNPASRAVKFINQLTLSTGHGEKLRLRPWQESIVRKLFGTLNPDGTRQYRTAFLMLPRKSGKTELAAALGLYSLMSDRGRGGQVIGAAVGREQAGLVFNVMKNMVLSDEKLCEVCQVIDSQKRIVYQPTQSFYRAIPADAPQQHGLGPRTVIYDELHAAPNRELYDVLRTSQGAQQEPLFIVITTAGFDRHSVCYELYQYAKRVASGECPDKTFLPIIFEAGADADWTDEKVWRDCNPALGDFRSLDEMRQRFNEAREIPALETAFRQLYLNQWVESSSRWLSSEAWERGNVPVDPVALHGQPCFAGLDLSTTTDLSALSLIFPHTDGSYSVLPFAWCPEDNALQRQNRDRVPYEVWIRQGLLRATPGNTVDHNRIRADINALGKEYNIRGIACDPWNAAMLMAQLQGDGFEITQFRQGYQSLNSPTKQLEVLVLGGKLRHGGHPILRWCASNVVIEMDPAGNYKPSKAKSTERIDCIVATIMGIGLATVTQPETSVYDTGYVKQIGVTDFNGNLLDSPIKPAPKDEPPKFNWQDWD
jgi:phage terminase large subunit-like protein